MKTKTTPKPTEIGDEIDLTQLEKLNNTTKAAQSEITKLLKLTLQSCYKPSRDYKKLLEIIEADEEDQWTNEDNILYADTESPNHSQSH